MELEVFILTKPEAFWLVFTWGFHYVSDIIQERLDVDGWHFELTTVITFRYVTLLLIAIYYLYNEKSQYNTYQFYGSPPEGNTWALHL